MTVFYRWNNIIGSFSLVFFILGFLPFMVFGQNASKSNPSIEGSTIIQSHFVENGLSQSNKDPSVQTSLFVPLGSQFKIGLWGSNVSYEGLNDHIQLRVPAEININFNKDLGLLLGYSIKQYYKDTIRNGNTVKIHLVVYDYKIIHEIESNWEGTETNSKYFGFGKNFPVFGNMIWSNQLGYTIVSVSGLNSFFDLRTGLFGQYNRIKYGAELTSTSNPSQFNGRGDIFVILSLGFGF